MRETTRCSLQMESTGRKRKEKMLLLSSEGVARRMSAAAIYGMLLPLTPSAAGTVGALIGAAHEIRILRCNHSGRVHSQRLQPRSDEKHLQDALMGTMCIGHKFDEPRRAQRAISRCIKTWSGSENYAANIVVREEPDIRGVTPRRSRRGGGAARAVSHWLKTSR
jgi:hypothetical protein